MSEDRSAQGVAPSTAGASPRVAVDLRSVPIRPVELPPIDLDVERRADGTILMRSRVPLAPHDPILPRVVAAQARALGDRPYLLERRKPSGDWVAQSYAETARASEAIAQWLIDQRVPADRPVLILSGNSIAHATLKFGAWAAGVPVCPVSANYGLMGPDFGRLKHVVALTRPGVVFVEDAAPFAAALSTLDFGDAIVLTRTPQSSPRPAHAWDDVLATPVTPAVEARIAALGPDQHAAYMLTSGSTGKPKAVIQTFRMIGANITQATQTLGRAAGWHGAMLDWLPWSHVSGVSGALNALVCGGTLYIDGGRPMPGLFEETLRNIRDVRGHYFVNVPIGYAMLADALEADPSLREVFFRNLHVMLYGGAGLPQPVYDRLQRMAIEATGRRIFTTTGYGATETTSGCMSIYWDTDKVGIGLPLPGTLVKLVPADGRYEIRVAGPIRMPGYLNQPEKNVGIFDDEGYYRLGDLVQFHDSHDPTQGLYFAGRLAEEFKLGTGTWIAGGHLRAQLLAALAPLVSELVVCGDGQTYIAILAWPDPVGVAREFGIKTSSPAELATHPGLATLIRDRLAAHNRASPGASTRVERCLLLTERPDPNAHEMSDKGTVNRSAVLERRAQSVAELYAEPAGSRVIAVE